MFAALQRTRPATAVRASVAVLACGSLGVLTACGDGGGGASASTVEIKPSSYEVRPAATTTTVVDEVTAAADGTAAGEQSFTIRSGDDVPWVVAQLYGISLDELRNYNGWDEDYSDYPGIGDTVRIPPGARFVDPAATTTTVSSTDDETDETDGTATDGTDGDDGDDEATENAGGERCNPVYVVEAGDAPLVITRKFDITIEELNAVNTATPDWPNLYTGREIRLPPPDDCS